MRIFIRQANMVDNKQ